MLVADALYCNYFLIATLMAAGAASNAGVDPRGLRFKHTVQL